MRSGRPGAGRSRGDLERLEARRRQAGQLFHKGVSQAEVARCLKVSPQSAHRWHEAWREGGVRALQAADRSGRPALLTPAQLREVERALLKGPLAQGYGTELWTCARVGEVIERLTGVRYHPGHVWKLLRAMGWSLQRPARRAKERDEEAVARWAKCRWPKIKGGLQDVGPGSSSRTSRASH